MKSRSTHPRHSNIAQSALPKETWDRKPILHEVYKTWWRTILPFLNTGCPTIEIGSGSSRMKEIFPDLITSEFEKVDGIDFCADAHRLPLRASVKKNIVMIDVFHHLRNPHQVLDEFSAVANTGDRLVLLETYISLFSYIAYKFIHHEPVVFGENVTKRGEKDDLMFERPNQCRAQLIFFREKEFFQSNYPELKIIDVKYLDFLGYPLSGGFNYRSLIPIFLFRLIQKVERIIPSYIMRLLGFKIMIVIERV
jgi:hypothetical protein